jgi:hypothetical protein
LVTERLHDRTKLPSLRVLGRLFVRPFLMAPFLYRCPTTGYQVQGWSADDTSENGNAYETLACLACGQVHLVNPSTGRVIGAAPE